MKLAIFVLATVTVVLAEPPVPSNIYLPGNQGPSNQYGPPRPSQNYGAPSFGQGGAGGRPGIQYGAPRPSTQYGAPGSGGGAGGHGGGGYDDQSEPANYQFKYDVQDAQSGNDFGHEEERHGDDARGKYYVLLPDGRRQTVEYTADNAGYKPKISYEQVGGGYGGGAGGYGSGAGGYQGGAGGYPSVGGGGGYHGGAGGYQGGAGGHQGGSGYHGGAGGHQGGGGGGAGGYQY